MRTSTPRITQRGIFAFWLPLAATWLMMSLEGPFLAAIIARLPEPKFNLAAFGVAFAFALVIEAPVIMILSASTALVRSPASFHRLRRYTYALNAAITLALVILVFDPLFSWIARDWIGLPAHVAKLTRIALVVMLPWPGAIGYRRFYQGLLIRGNRTRRVAYGTVVRLTTMAATALVLFVGFDLPGAWVGAAALSTGVCAEAVASRWMARGQVRLVLASQEEEDADASEPLTYRRITEFYWPLALTSTVSLAVHPMVTFFVGGSRNALESLAVLPVINALSFIFRSAGLSFQEVAIALLARREDNLAPATRFAAGLGIAASAGLAVIAWTPLAELWFETISGLSAELARFALPPTRILTVLPALSVLLSLQRGLLVHRRDVRGGRRDRRGPGGRDSRSRSRRRDGRRGGVPARPHRRQPVAGPALPARSPDRIESRPREADVSGDPTERRVRIVLAALLLFAAGVRGVHLGRHLASPLGLTEEVLVSTDLQAFAEWGRRIAGGDVLGRDTYHPYMDWMERIAPLDRFERWWGGREIFHQAPLYPYLVGASYAVAGSTVPLLVLQALAGTLAAYFAFLLGRAVRDDLAGLVAAALTALFAPAVVFDALLLRATWITLLTLGSLVAVLAMIHRPSRSTSLTAGIVLGLNVLLKPTGLPLVVLAVGIAAWATPRSEWKRWVPGLAAGLLLCAAPLVARNLAVGAPAKVIRLRTRGPAGE